MSTRMLCVCVCVLLLLTIDSKELNSITNRYQLDYAIN